jgi:hypothetical protein
MKLLAISLLVGTSFLMPASTNFPLDVVGGVGGIRFGELITQVPGFKYRFSGIGKRWRTTRLYTRLDDTTRLAGLGTPATYWFRQNRFIGVDIALNSTDAIQQELSLLTRQYGPASVDTLPNHWYWLGQNTYLLLEKNTKNSGVLFVASLAMLNEQVYETAVRARARRLLGWQPDSVGLPRQYPVR